MVALPCASVVTVDPDRLATPVCSSPGKLKVTGTPLKAPCVASAIFAVTEKLLPTVKSKVLLGVVLDNVA